MFRKTWVLSVAVALIVLGLCITPCLAQNVNNVTSVSKKGSLLIFPKIMTQPGHDTIITIGNDYPDTVKVKCYWMDWTQQHWDFTFSLTAYQPVWFAASTGIGTVKVSGFGQGNQGELKCWAIKELPDPGNPGGTIETQISWNHLYGSALILFKPYLTPSVVEYNAYAFAARNVALGSPVITPPDTAPGTLVLNGDSVLPGYDACPVYLTANFFALGGTLSNGTTLNDTVGRSDLALTPCKQDLRQDSSPICNKVKFDIWNENEAKLTGAYQCVKCWFEGILTDIGTDVWGGCDLGIGKCKATGFGGNKFAAATLKTNLGRFRITPDSFTACNGVFSRLGPDGKPVDVCSGLAFKTPFLGVLLWELDAPTNHVIGTTPDHAGAWVAGGTTQPIPAILWDAGVGSSPAPIR